MKSITIDRTKRLKEEPHTGIIAGTPIFRRSSEVDAGEEVVLETRDASDCQIKPGMTVADLNQPGHQGGPPVDRSGVRQGRQTG